MLGMAEAVGAVLRGEVGEGEGGRAEQLFPTAGCGGIQGESHVPAAGPRR